MLMTSDTQATTIPAPFGEVFAFLADPANLPRWAVGFARGIRREGEEWIVETQQGNVPVRIVADAAAGTIDFHLFPQPHIEVIAYSRVMPNADGSEYVFTQFQWPGMPDEVFAAQRAALIEELAILPLLFRAHAACPIGRS